MKFTSKYFVLIIILILASSSFARDCNDALYEASEVHIEVVAGVPKSYPNSLRKIITQVERELLKTLEIPSRYSIFIDREGDLRDQDQDFQYLFGYESQTIYMYYNVIGPNGKGKSQKYLLNHFIHELGHVILDANLQSSPVIFNYFEKKKQYGELRRRSDEILFLLDVFNENEDREEALSSQTFQRKKQELEDELSMVGLQLMALTPSAEEDIVLEIFEAYGELYADLAAVLFTGDGKAMYKAHHYWGDRNDKHSVYRDFTTRLDLETWLPSDEVHETFLPTRTFLWQQYLQGVSEWSPQKKSDFLGWFTKLLLQHVEKRILTPELQNSTAYERNKWLMEAITTSQAAKSFLR